MCLVKVIFIRVYLSCQKCFNIVKCLSRGVKNSFDFKKNGLLFNRKSFREGRDNICLQQ